MANVLNNLKHVWGQASLTHRMMLIGITCGLLAVVGLLVSWSTRPDLVLLYGGLTQEDAAQISQKLRDEDIPHKVKDGGTTILAPAEKIHELRLTMVAQGLPTGGNGGYKILDKEGLGSSPFKEKVNFVRAICGELEKTLMVFPGVTNARVMVVSPDQRLMARSRGEASASVYLKTRGGARLKRENVLAITNLVAGGVKGVTPDKVVVVVNGKLEAGQEKDELSAISGTLFEHKINYEKYMANKVETMLAAALGPGRATVQVDASFSTKTLQKTERKIYSDQQALTKTSTTKIKDEAIKDKNGGSSGGSTDNTTEEAFDYPSDTIQTVERPGKIEYLSVSVLVDLSQPNNETKEGEEAGAPVKMPTVAQIKTAVENIVGLNNPDLAESKSVVSVEDIVFQKVESNDKPVEEAGMFSMDFILEIAKRGSLGFAVLGMLLAMKIIRGKKAKEAAAGSPGTENAEGAMGGGSAQSAQQSHQFKGADRALKTKISNALTNNPNQVKQLFLSWVESSQSK